MTKQYMGHSPKRNSNERKSAQMAMQRNLHHSDDHGEFSHLLTSINWWSSQKGENHTQEHKQAEG